MRVAAELKTNNFVSQELVLEFNKIPVLLENALYNEEKDYENPLKEKTIKAIEDMKDCFSEFRDGLNQLIEEQEKELEGMEQNFISIRELMVRQKILSIMGGFTKEMHKIFEKLSEDNVRNKGMEECSERRSEREGMVYLVLPESVGNFYKKYEKFMNYLRMEVKEVKELSL